MVPAVFAVNHFFVHADGRRCGMRRSNLSAGAAPMDEHCVVTYRFRYRAASKYDWRSGGYCRRLSFLIGHPPPARLFQGEAGEPPRRHRAPPYLLTDPRAQGACAATAIGTGNKQSTPIERCAGDTMSAARRAAFRVAQIPPPSPSRSGPCIRPVSPPGRVQCVRLRAGPSGQPPATLPSPPCTIRLPANRTDGAAHDNKETPCTLHCNEP